MSAGSKERPLVGMAAWRNSEPTPPARVQVARVKCKARRRVVSMTQ